MSIMVVEAATEAVVKVAVAVVPMSLQVNTNGVKSLNVLTDGMSDAADREPRTVLDDV